MKKCLLVIFTLSWIFASAMQVTARDWAGEGGKCWRMDIVKCASHLSFQIIGPKLQQVSPTPENITVVQKAIFDAAKEKGVALEIKSKEELPTEFLALTLLGAGNDKDTYEVLAGCRIGLSKPDPRSGISAWYHAQEFYTLVRPIPGLTGTQEEAQKITRSLVGPFFDLSGGGRLYNINTWL